MTEIDPTTTLDVLHLSVRTMNALRCAGINTLSDLTACSVRDLRRKPNVGTKALREVIGALSRRNLTLKDFSETQKAEATEPMVRIQTHLANAQRELQEVHRVMRDRLDPNGNAAREARLRCEAVIIQRLLDREWTYDEIGDLLDKSSKSAATCYGHAMRMGLIPKLTYDQLRLQKQKQQKRRRKEIEDTRE